jgi:hypothetical protein
MTGFGLVFQRKVTDYMLICVGKRNASMLERLECASVLNAPLVTAPRSDIEESRRWSRNAPLESVEFIHAFDVVLLVICRLTDCSAEAQLRRHNVFFIIVLSPHSSSACEGVERD